MVGSVHIGMDATNLDDLYGSPLLEWSRIASRLDWLVRSGGSEHHRSRLGTRGRSE